MFGSYSQRQSLASRGAQKSFRGHIASVKPETTKSRPRYIQLGVWWSAVRSPSRVRGGASGAARGRWATPRNLGSQENSWLRRWAKYTKLCMIWQPNILNNCNELSGGYAPPRTTHQGLCPWTRAGRPPFPRPPVPPTSKSWLRHWAEPQPKSNLVKSKF